MDCKIFWETNFGGDTDGMKKISQNALDILIKTIEFVLILTVILDCNSVYRLRWGWNFEPHLLALWVANVSAYLLLVLWIIKDKTNFECVRDMKALILISFLMITEYNAFFVQKLDSGFVGYFFFFVTAMVLLYQVYRKNGKPFHLLFLMEYVILFIAIVSVILWIGSSILELWGRNSDLKVFWGGIYFDANYLNICIRRWVFDGDLTKNLGIFVEPPMFGLFLGFGLYTELFLKKKSNVAIVVSFLIALISCRAILAIMLALLALVFLFAELIWHKKFAKILIPVMAILGCIAVAGLFIYKMKTGWGSLATHIDDFKAALQCWLHYPIWGCGYDREMPIQEFMSDFRSNNLGLSNSAAVVLAEGGIVLFAFYFLPFLFMMLAFFKKNRKFAFWGAGMFLFWVVVIFHTRLFIFFLLALGYSMVKFKVRLLNVKENEKRVEAGITYFDENQSEEKGYFSKTFLDLPVGFILIMTMILVGSAVYGLISFKDFNVQNLISSIFILLAEALLLFWNLKKKSLSKLVNSICQIGIWLFYMLVGQPYRVLDSFYTVTKLHIQDCWWKFIVVVIGLYFIGTLLDFCFNKRNNN